MQALVEGNHVFVSDYSYVLFLDDETLVIRRARAGEQCWVFPPPPGPLSLVSSPMDGIFLDLGVRLEHYLKFLNAHPLYHGTPEEHLLAYDQYWMSMPSSPYDHFERHLLSRVFDWTRNMAGGCSSREDQLMAWAHDVVHPPQQA